MSKYMSHRNFQLTFEIENRSSASSSALAVSEL